MRHVFATRHSERERGSVFIVALMVLVMLTVVGLSLALVTETEMLIGGNEQVINETFFAAEAGLAAGVSQLMVANSTDSKCLGLLAKDANDSTRRVGVRTAGYAVDITTLYPVAFSNAPGSKANEGAKDTIFAGYFRAAGRSMRGTWPESAARPVPREMGEELVDIDFTVQAQKEIELAFYSTPLESLEARALTEGFDRPELYGCEPRPEHLEIVAGP